MDKKIAIVYDWFDKWGGVERVLLTLHEIFPKAIFFTSYWDKEKANWAKNLVIKTSFIQKLPKFIKKNRLLSLLFYPIAFETFDFSEFDLVISVTSSFAKGVIVKPPTKHIVYLLTPTRFLWVMPENYHLTSFRKKLLSPYLNYLKKWDLAAISRANQLISISNTVKERCIRYYQRKTQVIYPPFDFVYWQMIKSKLQSFKSEKFEYDDYFLVVSRLESYKKVDLVIDVFNKLNKRLIVVGDGSQKNKLKRLANKNITFLENLSDVELGYLYTKAEALIIPQEEDFGYVALESVFFGCPVIAYKKGGVLEIVSENKTGLFFKQQNQDSLKKALAQFQIKKEKLKKYLKKNNFAHLEKFDKIDFIQQFKKYI
ncbi:MAG: glycosyltransferase [Microgenomates group bacterium]